MEKEVDCDRNQERGHPSPRTRNVDNNVQWDQWCQMVHGPTHEAFEQQGDVYRDSSANKLRGVWDALLHENEQGRW